VVLREGVGQGERWGIETVLLSDVECLRKWKERMILSKAIDSCALVRRSLPMPWLTEHMVGVHVECRSGVPMSLDSVVAV